MWVQLCQLNLRSIPGLLLRSFWPKTWIVPLLFYTASWSAVAHTASMNDVTDANYREKIAFQTWKKNDYTQVSDQFCIRTVRKKNLVIDLNVLSVCFARDRNYWKSHHSVEHYVLPIGQPSKLFSPSWKPIEKVTTKPKMINADNVLFIK